MFADWSHQHLIGLGGGIFAFVLLIGTMVFGRTATTSNALDISDEDWRRAWQKFISRQVSFAAYLAVMMGFYAFLAWSDAAEFGEIGSLYPYFAAALFAGLIVQLLWTSHIANMDWDKAKTTRSARGLLRKISREMTEKFAGRFGPNGAVNPDWRGNAE
tara:strand:- start:18994 stop:19470 length:477 start_codon:yes stop_codon:yes gene_type:complete